MLIEERLRDEESDIVKSLLEKFVRKLTGKKFKYPSLSARRGMSGGDGGGGDSGDADS